jgi:hypothetical protein
VLDLEFFGAQGDVLGGGGGANLAARDPHLLAQPQALLDDDDLLDDGQDERLSLVVRARRHLDEVPEGDVLDVDLLVPERGHLDMLRVLFHLLRDEHPPLLDHFPVHLHAVGHEREDQRAALHLDHVRRRLGASRGQRRFTERGGGHDGSPLCRDHADAGPTVQQSELSGIPRSRAKLGIFRPSFRPAAPAAKLPQGGRAP